MIFIDFETRSTCVIQDTGAWRYAEHPSTEVLCLAFAIDDGPVQLWVPGEGFPFAHLNFRDARIEAHHVGFERAIWENIMVKRHGWPAVQPAQWACSAALSAYYALPRSLSEIGAALGLKTVKDMSGKRVMMKLSRPRVSYGKDDPAEMWSNKNDDFRALYQYCRDDVAAERAINRRLKPLPPGEEAIWRLDQAINARGLRVDMQAVKAALALLAASETRLKAEFKALTGIESPTMVAQFKKWLVPYGLKMETLNKGDVLTALKIAKGPAKRALEIRQALSKTSTAKYKAIADSVCADGRLRGILMYHGASTGRWTGMQVQPQNLPRNTFRGDFEKYFEFLTDPFTDLDTFEMLYPVAETLSKTIRGVFIPSDGHVFVGGDYNAIEARVLFWLASEARGLQMFREGQDIYKDMAATIYQVPVEKVTKEQRELGKRGILGCGYGMGAEKFRETCRIQAGLILPEGMAERAVEAYRTKYRTVAVLWQLQELAAKQAIETKKPIRCGKVTWGVHDGFLFCRLPSGRCLAYYDPKIEMVETSWGEKRPAVTHMGMNSVTRKWERQSTYGGKIVENITQAVARDVMANAMLNCEAEGFKVVLTVHDELLTEKVRSQSELWDKCHTVDALEKIMTTLPAWAEGLPVKAEGWTGWRYRK